MGILVNMGNHLTWLIWLTEAFSLILEEESASLKNIVLSACSLHDTKEAKWTGTGHSSVTQNLWEF